MELILKQPKDKPPCICIAFEQEFEAEQINKSWINNYNTHLCSLTFDLNNERLNLTIEMSGMGWKYKYEDLKFSPEKLQKFLNDNAGAGINNFCHVTQKGDVQTVVRTV